MKKLVIGILAHVDAGKTTLAESILYLTGSIRTLGRVDHKDAFLDTNELERARGITIFSKQAQFVVGDMEVTLLDTPGHVDFSAEMERTLQVLDYAILVISGSDGVQGHTKTLWKLLERYRIPTFLFVNKMDMDGTDRGTLMQDLKRRLNEGCINFSKDQDPKTIMENIAMCDEILLDEYIESGVVGTKETAALIAERKTFPCYFGSALKLDGVEAFLEGLEQYTRCPSFQEPFGAKIYKIGRDEQGNRLTFMKITGGILKVKTLLTNGSVDASLYWEEKVNQIRIYSGARFETKKLADAGTVCAVTGLSRTYPGEGLGIEPVSKMPMLEPILNYQILLPSGYDSHQMLRKLRELEEEDPQLHIVWSEQLKEIHVQLMGEVQIEILKSLIFQRFGIHVEFGCGNIVYKETILEPVEGVGHFEPLRHYAEVHLLLEPGERGSGLEFCSSCSEDGLDRNWQRLILTHLEEKEHVGVLTGSPITDMKISLIAGRANQKHTEGGDFRQATYRALRQGLKKAESILLEPYYDYRLEIPSEMVGRAMSDMQRMSGTFQPPELDAEMSVLTGCVSVAAIRGYQTELTAYTKGKGRIFCTLKGYAPCHNAQEVIDSIGYDSERDLENPTGSVFCAHGAGFVVEWDKVNDYMHIDSGWQQPKQEETKEIPAVVKSNTNYGSTWKMDRELEDIFVRTFGPIRQKIGISRNGFGYEKMDGTQIHGAERDGAEINVTENDPMNHWTGSSKSNPVKEYLLVDGYNIIFSWRELNELAKVNMDAARNKLMDILCNYQGFKKMVLILVFDAYKVKGGVGTVMDYHNIHVVYTKEAETADGYIEKTTHEIAREHHVTVATSDALEQLIILGQGAVRLSANDLKEDVDRVMDQIRRDYLDRPVSGRNYLGERFENHMMEHLKGESEKG